MTGRVLLDDWLFPLLAGPQTSDQAAAQMLRMREAATNAYRELIVRGYVQRTSKRPYVYSLTGEGKKRAELFFKFSQPLDPTDQA